MSTEPQTGATPASFSAHATSRNDTSTILSTQATLVEKYGTVINCNFNYYTESGVRLIEKEITSTLSVLSEDEDGFFLMYEEGHIDKFCHNNDAEGAFDSVIRFNQAIGVFMEYTFYHPDTFVIITADHETGGLWPTNDGYLEFNTTSHSGVNVPVFAYGKDAGAFENFEDENTQIPKNIAALLGVTEFGD